jgi:hypothetical protein
MRAALYACLMFLGLSLASADDSAPWRPSARKINSDCTLGGAVSKVCVDLYIKVEDGRAGHGPVATGGEKSALTCILGASGYLASSPAYRAEVKYDQTSDATDLIASGEEATPYGKECVRATNLAVGNDSWQKRGGELKARAAWATHMKDTVHTTFAKKCGGVHATLDGDSFAELTIERVTSSNKVFYEGKDGTGSHVRVTCGGKITMRSASGGTMVQTARTSDQDHNDMDQFQCLQTCAHTNKVCLAHNQNVTVTACRNACLPSCS